jgi:hypothetical protein
MADYKFEIVANEFLTNSDGKSVVTIKRRGGFKRAYSKEIAKTSITENQTGGGRNLVMELNLDGIFDHLPEELFHHQSRLRQQENLSFAQKHRIKKEEEANSRAFFHPIENEFSNLLILLESYEKNLMDNNNGSDQVYSFFSDLPEKSNLSVKASAKLNFFYPLLPYFRGDSKFLQYVLTSILLKPVKVLVEEKTIQSNYFLGGVVGEMLMGYDSYLGNESSDSFSEVCIHVSELHSRDTPKFMPDGDASKIIQLISQMILPLQTDFRVQVSYSLQEGVLRMGVEGGSSVLGYNSYLH